MRRYLQSFNFLAFCLFSCINGQDARKPIYQSINEVCPVSSADIDSVKKSDKLLLDSVINNVSEKANTIISNDTTTKFLQNELAKSQESTQVSPKVRIIFSEISAGDNLTSLLLKYPDIQYSDVLNLSVIDFDGHNLNQINIGQNYQLTVDENEKLVLFTFFFSDNKKIEVSFQPELRTKIIYL